MTMKVKYSRLDIPIYFLRAWSLFNVRLLLWLFIVLRSISVLLWSCFNTICNRFKNLKTVINSCGKRSLLQIIQLTKSIYSSFKTSLQFAFLFLNSRNSFVVKRRVDVVQLHAVLGDYFRCIEYLLSVVLDIGDFFQTFFVHCWTNFI